MRWAIIPKGIAKPVGRHAIEDNAELPSGAIFTLPEGTNFDGKVLAENGLSLRDGTPQELDTTPTLDQIYDETILTQRVLRALVLALNDGTFVPGSNYTGAQIKARIKSKMA